MIQSNHFSVYGDIKVGNRYLSLIVFQAGSNDTASTRLRALPLLDKLENKRSLCFEELLSSNIQDKSILWFQKKITEEHLIIARKYKNKGAQIFYDCDESGPALSYWAKPHLAFEMFHIADHITADTPERIHWIKKSASMARLSILENQIDYGIPRNILGGNDPPRVNRKTRILWYGNACNLSALKDSLIFFKNSEDFQLVLCGASAHDVSVLQPGCDVEIHPWSQSTFLDILASCDLCILSHHGSRSDYRKSGHKMITSICHGVPVVASATPDYIRIARYAGVQDYLFSNVAELEKVLSRLIDPDSRRHYLSAAKPVLQKKYYPGSYADNAILILNRASQARLTKPRVYQRMMRGKFYPMGSIFVRACGKTYWRWMQS